MKIPINILLADDDSDDRFFFSLALKEVLSSFQLNTAVDGEELMNYLIKNSETPPDVLFLDLNMPKKNGSECLAEIKRNSKLKNIPVVIYSTSVQKDTADVFYKSGAFYYVRKCEFEELKRVLKQVLFLIETQNEQPERKNFIVNPD